MKRLSFEFYCERDGEELRRRWRSNRRSGLQARISRWRVLDLLLLPANGLAPVGLMWRLLGDPIDVWTEESVSRRILPFGSGELASAALMIC